MEGVRKWKLEAPNDANVRYCQFQVFSRNIQYVIIGDARRNVNDGNEHTKIYRTGSDYDISPQRITQRTSPTAE